MKHKIEILQYENRLHQSTIDHLVKNNFINSDEEFIFHKGKILENLLKIKELENES